MVDKTVCIQSLMERLAAFAERVGVLDLATVLRSAPVLGLEVMEEGPTAFVRGEEADAALWLNATGLHAIAPAVAGLSLQVCVHAEDADVLTVMGKAEALGMILRTDRFQISRRPERHGRPQRVFESVIYPGRRWQ